MARNQQQKTTKSKPSTFVGGMISDIDPRYQPENSYRYAKNLRLISKDGLSLSLENINGNLLSVDISDRDIVNNIDDSKFIKGTSDHYLHGELYGSQIVGYYSYQNVLLLIVIVHADSSVTPPYAQDGTANSSYTTDGTHKVFFLKLTFNPNSYELEEVRDLMVCYNFLNSNWPSYEHLNMLNELPLRVEGLVENGCITRIYWTDNQNPLRSINISGDNLHNLTPDELGITPVADMTQPILSEISNGSLPVGVYQYCFKYVNENGTESGMSPFSTLVQTSNASAVSSSLYQGSPTGGLTGQGVILSLNNLDTDYEYIELYALFWEDLNVPPRVSVVDKKYISGNSSIEMYHSVWQNEIEDGLNQILIQTNTFDTCKDIAIKDNILFAANLRSRQNIIEESEWNIRVMRWKLNDIQDTTPVWTTGTLTSKDSSVVMHQSGAEIDSNNFTNSSYTEYVKLNADCNNHNAAHRYLSTKNDDFPVLGAESYQYGEANVNEGCRVTFRMGRKGGDSVPNRDTSPFVEVSNTIEDFKLDGPEGASTPNSTDNVYTATMSFGSNKDPQAAGTLRGYQRGETYRFGVLVFDKTGNPGNVLWIGDIQMPQHYDLCRQINRDHHIPGKLTSDDDTKFTFNGRTQDFRLDSVEGYMVPQLNLSFEHNKWGSLYAKKKRVLGLPFSSGAVSANSSMFYAGQAGGHPNTQRPFPCSDGYPVLEEDVNGDLTGNVTFSQNKSHKHEVHDLFVDFEFIIPEEVRNKISGFQVVRAERNEVNKSVIATGLLNQTAKYGYQGEEAGSASTRLAGYQPDTREWVDKFDTRQNGFIGNDSWTSLSSTNFSASWPAVPEYDEKLNGFIGIQEHCTAYGYDPDCDSNNTGTTTEHACGQTSINTSPSGDANTNYTAGTNQSPQENIYANPDGDGGGGGEASYSQYFGSYEHCLQDRMFVTSDDCTTVNFGNNDDPNPYAGTTLMGNYDYFKVDTVVSGTTTMNKDYDTGGVKHQVWTFDSPDSAFGVKGYVYNSSHKLRITSALSLIRNDKHNHGSFDNAINPNITWNTSPWNQDSNFPYFWIPIKTNTGTAKKAATGFNDKQISDSNCAREFCSRKETDDSEHSGYLIAKWYTMDTNFYHEMMAQDGSGGFRTNHSYLGDGASNGSNQGQLNWINMLSPWYAATGSNSFTGNNSALIQPGTDITSDSSPIRDPNSSAPIGSQTPLKHGFGHAYTNQIVNAKEIADGEIVPASFFKNIKYKGRGFSNYTLGFTKYGAPVNPNVVNQLRATYYTPTDIKTDTNHFSFVKFHQSLSNPEIDNNDQHDYSTTANSNYDDMRYETLSSMQAGLRSILIELKNPLFVRHIGRIAFERNMYDNNTEHYRGSVPGHTNTSGGYSMCGLGGYPRNSNTGVSADRNMLIPYKLLGQIVRDVDNQYGGDDKFAIEETTYMPCGPFQQVTDTSAGGIEYFNTVAGGDTFVNLYSHQKTINPYHKYGYSKVQLFPVETYVNTDMRSGNNLLNGNIIEGTRPQDLPNQNDWLYNSVYSQEANLKHYLPIRSSQCRFKDLPYEIAYSRTKVSGEVKDSFKSFPMFNFHDVEGAYGPINRIFNYQDEIYTLQDNAFAKILVNPRTLIQTTEGAGIYTGTGETVENHQYVSTKYGSRHRFSIVFSENSVYFVDVNRDAIVKFNTQEGIDVISDTKGIRNLLTSIISNPAGNLKSYNKVILNDIDDKWENEEYIRNLWSDYIFKQVGINGVYDKENQEVLFTFFDQTLITNSPSSSSHNIYTITVSYNETLNVFSSFYDFFPCLWISHMGKIFNPKNRLYDDRFITGNLTGNASLPGGSIVASTTGGNDWSTDNQNIDDLQQDGLQLWRWNDGDYRGQMFGLQTTSTITGDEYPSELKYAIVSVLNDAPSENKKFDNAQVIMSPGIRPANSFNQSSNPGIPLIHDIIMKTDTITSTGINVTGENNILARYREGVVRFPLRSEFQTNRMSGTYLEVLINIFPSSPEQNPQKFNIFAILGKIRKSFN
jgi:hypothetical protein